MHVCDHTQFNSIEIKAWRFVIVTIKFWLSSGSEKCLGSNLNRKEDIQVK